MFFRIKRFFSKIWKIIQWVSVLWEDEDWDGDYSILSVLSYKLKRVKKVLEEMLEVDYIDEAECGEKIRAVQKACDLMKSIQENEFCKGEWEEFDKKWGELDMSFIDYKGGREIVMSRKNALSEEDKEKENAERRVISALELERYDNAYYELFDLLEKNIRNWESD